MKNRPIITLCMALAISTSTLFAEHTSMPCDKCTKLDKVNEMKEEMQLKLKFDPLVNLPILARTFNQHNQDVTLALSKEQKIAIQHYKLQTMDSILPIMKSSHELSKKLKEGILYGTLSEEEANKMANEIAKQKESVLAMKINCILFFRKTLSKEQFARLLELDKEAFYLNSPYNY
ncbi:MAG: hypothetical protein FNT15_06635 [Sulfurovum sp.]|nr:MAG: hypothetical protein FNT15_06635 [Sulfurovum sp.]